MLQAVLDKLVEADGVDKQRAVDSIDRLYRDAGLGQYHSVNAVTIDWILVLWLQNNAWDVQMLGVLKRLIDPGLEHLWTHLHLLVLALESGALRHDLSGATTESTLFANCCHLDIHGCLDSTSRPTISLAVCLTRSKIEVCTSCNRVSILALHLLAQLLSYDRNVKKAFERTIFANLGQLEALTTVD